MDEDDDITLSEHARLALQVFVEENLKKRLAQFNDTEDVFVDEDWELSQFWYDTETSSNLAKAAITCVGKTGRIACVSCPSVYNQLRKMSSELDEHYLFEYDKRFQEKFPERGIFYDYKDPLNVDEKFKSYFDIVLADPPYLSQECLEKFTKTLKFLTNKKIVFCTGAVMEESVKELLNLTTCNFKPQHERKLGNEFKCYSNFDLDDCIMKVKSVSDISS